MLPNYKILKGLPNPVNSIALLDTFNKKQVYVQMATNVEEVVSPELLQVFKDLGLTPNFFCLFGKSIHNEPQDYISPQAGKIWVHTDIRYLDGAWHKMPFGLNWELVPGKTYFTWWDTKDAEECYPPATENSQWCQPDSLDYGLQGIHYGHRGNHDASSFDVLETIKMDYNTPYLVRADIPHSVSYVTKHKQRIGFSVRFPLEQIPTWERALEVFKPLYE